MELSRTLPFNVLLLTRVSEGNADSVNSLCSNAAFPNNFIKLLIVVKRPNRKVKDK